MRIASRLAPVILVLALGGCMGGQRLPPSMPAPGEGAPGAAPAPPPTVAMIPPPAPGVPAVPPVPLVPGALYTCVRVENGGPVARAIAYEPAVEGLCRRHPEMGPCQYEREACRRAGGRVYTAEGVEITRATEAEYDRRVTRIRLPTN